MGVRRHESIKKNLAHLAILGGLILSPFQDMHAQNEMPSKNSPKPTISHYQDTVKKVSKKLKGHLKNNEGSYVTIDTFGSCYSRRRTVACKMVHKTGAKYIDGQKGTGGKIKLYESSAYISKNSRINETKYSIVDNCINGIDKIVLKTEYPGKKKASSVISANLSSRPQWIEKEIGNMNYLDKITAYQKYLSNAQRILENMK